MKVKDKESGQVLVITAFCMIGFMGFLALAVDVGILFHTRWQLQIAADAAATAAAVEYLHNGYDKASAITVGTNAATANNVSDGNIMTATVTVNTNAPHPCPTRYVREAPVFSKPLSVNRIPPSSTAPSSPFGKGATAALSLWALERWLELLATPLAAGFLQTRQVRLFKPMATTRSMRPVAAYMSTRQVHLR
jgi:Flp pilus assembly protein TadG